MKYREEERQVQEVGPSLLRLLCPSRSAADDEPDDAYVHRGPVAMGSAWTQSACGRQRVTRILAPQSRVPELGRPLPGPPLYPLAVDLDRATSSANSPNHGRFVDQVARVRLRITRSPACLPGMRLYHICADVGAGVRPAGSCGVDDRPAQSREGGPPIRWRWVLSVSVWVLRARSGLLLAPEQAEEILDSITTCSWMRHTARDAWNEELSAVHSYLTVTHCLRYYGARLVGYNVHSCP